VDDALYYKCTSTDFNIAVSAIPTRTLAVLGGTWSTKALNASLVRFYDDYGLPKNVILRGIRYSSENPYVQPLWINRKGGNVEVSRCTFAQYGGGQFILQRGSYVVKNNVFYGYNITLNKGPEVPAYTGEQNLYFETNMVPALFAVGAAMYNGLPAWRAATGHDMTSVDGDPQFSGSPRMGDFRTAPTSPTWSLGAGAEFEGEDKDVTLQAYRRALDP